MPIIVLFLIIFGIAVGIGLGLTVLSGLGSLGTHKDERVKSLQADLRNSMATKRIAVKGLRVIANGAGAPILEAQDALDKIENLETKELY